MIQNISNTSKAHLAAAVTILIWSTAYLSVKVLLRDLSATEIFFYRFLIAYFALFLMHPKRIGFKNLKEELLFASSGLFGITLYIMMQSSSLKYTLASNAAVLNSVAPFFIAIFSLFLADHERLKRRFFIGFVIAITGIILISFNGNFVLKLNPLGDFLALFSAVAWALYSIILRKLTTLGYPIIPFTRKLFFYGILFLVPILPFSDFHWEPALLIQPQNLFHLFYLGIFSSALCFVIWNYSVGSLGAIRTSVYLYLMPVATVILSAILLREQITIISAAGVVLIVTGLFISEDIIQKMRSK